MIYGSRRDRNISRLLRFLRLSPVMPVFGDGQALQQPVYVEDLADAVIAALDRASAVEQAYDLSGAEPLTFAELVRTAGRAIGREPRLLYAPARVGYAAASAAALLPGPRILKPEQIARLAEDKAFSHDAATRDLGFRPRSFAEGVRLEAAALEFAAGTRVAV
jgi:nucleoside-diphosphate-sugar epimerase